MRVRTDFLGDKRVLAVSPHRAVDYFVGRFDPRNVRFHTESRGLIDHSFDFYAPNSLCAPDDRRILWGCWTLPS